MPTFSRLILLAEHATQCGLIILLLKNTVQIHVEKAFQATQDKYYTSKRNKEMDIVWLEILIFTLLLLKYTNNDQCAYYGSTCSVVVCVVLMKSQEDLHRVSSG